MDDKYYKHIVWSLIGLGIFVTSLLIAGPYRVNPHIAALLGLEMPSEVPPVPVPRAEEVGTRVLDAVREDGIRTLMDQFTQHESRVVGYEGHEKTADFIISEFRRFGMEDVEAETYSVAVPIDQGRQLNGGRYGRGFYHSRFVAESGEDDHFAHGGRAGASLVGRHGRCVGI